MKSFMVKLGSVLALLAVQSLASSLRKTPTTEICRQLDRLQSSTTILPSEVSYGNLSTDNWSQTAWAHPTCIVRPADTARLQQVVRLLTEHNIQFAIRSGGHLPSPLGANINTGVLIDLSPFSQVDYDADNSVVTIGPGLRWGEVYEALEQYGMTAVGGRLLDVGVGGLILGSGLSYLSDLHGLACDNVVNFEVNRYSF